MASPRSNDSRPHVVRHTMIGLGLQPLAPGATPDFLAEQRTLSRGDIVTKEMFANRDSADAQWERLLRLGAISPATEDEIAAQETNPELPPVNPAPAPPPAAVSPGTLEDGEPQRSRK